MCEFIVTISNGKNDDRFPLNSESIDAVKELCDIVHVGTGWSVKSVIPSPRKRKSKKRQTQSLSLF